MDIKLFLGGKHTLPMGITQFWFLCQHTVDPIDRISYNRYHYYYTSTHVGHVGENGKSCVNIFLNLELRIYLNELKEKVFQHKTRGVDVDECDMVHI